MKKTRLLFLSLLMIFSLVACSNVNKKDNQNKDATQLKDGKYEGKAKANKGDLAVEVEIKNGKIKDITIKENQETKGLGDVAMDSVKAEILKLNSTQVDTIVGATNSSKGLIDAVREALKQAGATDDYFKNEKKPEKTATKDTEKTFDVVVVGGGGAGLAAAIEAGRAGAKVVIVEKTMALGGNTLISGGGLNAPGTRHQINKGIKDSAQQYYEDTYKSGDMKGDPTLIKVMADNALDAANWLIDDIKVEFMPDRIQQFGGHSVPRALVPIGNSGAELISKLAKAAEAAKVEIAYGNEATELIVKDDKVVGVKAKTKDGMITYNANKGVILASGGFASNVEMRKKYNKDYDERFMTTASLSSRGDGIVMAQAIGADVTGMEHIQVYPTCNPKTGIISYVANSRFDGALLFNKEGKRFVNEMGRRDEISHAILAQSDKMAYLVWGQEIETVGKMTKLHEAEFKHMLDQDVIFKADSLAEAAKHFGVDSDQLMKTIDAYNLSIADKKDEDFKKGGALKEIKQGPFYFQKVIPSAHHTMGGLKINTSAQVLNKDGKVINGLYAAGEVTGGIHGTNRLGGNAITDIIVFGRIAGQNIVK